MNKFNAGNIAVAKRDINTFGIKKGYLYKVEGVSADGAIHIGNTAYSQDLFSLHGEPSLQSLYEAERDKLTAQQYSTTAAWELVVAEKLLEQNTRKAIIHAKRVEVECVRDKLKEASDLYLKVSNELDEMLRNEPM
jgi:hypothetical protein